jgi:hypothetical protein
LGGSGSASSTGGAAPRPSAKRPLPLALRRRLTAVPPLAWCRGGRGGWWVVCGGWWVVGGGW